MKNENIGDELKELITKIIKEVDCNLEKEDVKEIVNSLIPELDNLVAKRVKQHFQVFSKFLITSIEEFSNSLNNKVEK